MYEDLPKTRNEALAVGSPQFYTGRPCKRGHLSPRQTKNSTCLDCKKISDAKYREKNPDMAMEYHIANRDVVLDRQRKYREENKDICRLATKRWRANNPDKVKEHHRNYRTNNPENFRRSIKDWEQRNPGKVKAHRVKRKIAVKNATPEWASMHTIALFYKLADIYRDEFGGDWHVDHIIPIRGKDVCGLHVENNLRVIRAEENISKSNKLIEELL